MNLILLPIFILQFWYLEAPVRLLIYFFNFNRGFLHLFSLPLMLRTFFKPWKNEYRDGLVGISIFMGMVFKTLFIIADLFLLIFIIFFEIILFLAFLVFPVAVGYLSFVKLI